MPADAVTTRLPLAVLLACAALAGCGQSYCSTCPPPHQEPALTCGNFDDASARKLEDVIAGGEAPRILMISGGGSYGAWGSGFLNGWSENPTKRRPTFDLVTGSSTGAILGTWAFLGEDADKSARCAYTNTSDDDVYEKALISWEWLQPWNWVGNDWRSIKPWVSLKNLKPLRHLFEVYTPVSQIERVGEIYRKDGRMFIVGTVDINLGTFCLWDMGKIAQVVYEAPDGSAEQKKAYELYREIVMASSSNPGIFNPTTLEGDMHVDGGVRFQIFLQPKISRAIRAGMQRRDALHPHVLPPDPLPEAGLCNADVPSIRPQLYGIVNMPMSIPRTCTSENIYNVAQRSLTVTQIQAMIGNLFEARWQLEHEIGKPGQWDFCMTQIPESYVAWPFADEFPECRMRDMYDAAFARATSAKPWNTELPGNEYSPHPCEHAPRCKKKDRCETPAPGCPKL